MMVEVAPEWRRENAACDEAAHCPDLSWSELIGLIDMRRRMTVEEGLLNGLSALHRAVFATGSGPVSAMIDHLDASLAALAEARAALVAGCTQVRDMRQ
jgi:hypothetical protein